MAMNCASSFRGLHEAIINTATTSPEILTCPHEEIAVAMAHGYVKIEGKPMAVICHGTVGLQHAAMALYNAWCDRVPVYMHDRQIVEATKRLPGAEWVHAAIDIGAIVRDFIKWDDQPASLQHFAESAVRAYKIAMTPPMGPVLLSLDAELQENPIPDAEALRIPKLAKVMPPQGDSGAVAETAKLLVKAENPVIICDRLARTPAGLERLVELAETLQCAVIDNAGRMNFPTRHPLNHELPPRPGAGPGRRDLGARDERFLGRAQPVPATASSARSRPITKKDAKIITLGTRDLYPNPTTRTSSASRTSISPSRPTARLLPALIEAVKRLDRRRPQGGLRGARQEARRRAAAMIEQAKSDATLGWDASPISTARMCAELYAQIKDEDWSLVGNAIRNWPQRLWNIEKPYQWNGARRRRHRLQPAGLARRGARQPHGRLTRRFGGDGDFMFVPGTLWTAAHHQIPMLYVMHNNRAYHQEVMYVQAMATATAAASSNAHIGTTLDDPNIDYATMARGFGVHGEGPITDPKDLAPALKRALAVVKSGQPALVDVVTEPR